MHMAAARASARCVFEIGGPIDEPIEAALCAARAIARAASSEPLAADGAELGETTATRAHRARLAQWAECRGSRRLRIIEPGRRRIAHGRSLVWGRRRRRHPAACS